MSEKHLTELPWKTLVTKQGVKDLGLGKALGAYADFSAAQELSKALEKLAEIIELAAKLKKTYATKDEVVTHLEEMVKEVKKTTPVLEAKAKSAATAQAKSATAVAASAKPEPAGKPSAEDLEEEKEAAELKKNLKQQMLSALAQVKARAPGGPEQEEDPKPQLKFMAYLAGKNCAVVVGRQVGSATKKLLPEVAGGASGGQYVQGECIFEKNAHTFVLAKVPGGLAKKLASALHAETGQKCKVRARSIDGSVTLDSETDVDPDATPMSNSEQMAKFKERLTGLLPEIKAKPHLKAAPGTKDEKGLNVVASEAAYFAKNNDFSKAKQLLDLVESLLKNEGASPGNGKVPVSQEELERAGEVKLKVSGMSNDMSKALEGGDSAKSAEFDKTLSSYVAKSPALESLLHKLLKEKGVKVRFDEEAKDAHFDGSEGADGTIVLPLKNSAVDIVDALLFEAFNADNHASFGALDDEFRKSLDTAPLSFAEYGKRKATLESETILKNAQMLFALQQASAPIAYQGQRNLDKTAQTIIKNKLDKEGATLEKSDKAQMGEVLKYLQGLLSVSPEEGLLNPPPRNKTHDAAIQKLIQGVLPTLDNPDNKKTKEALVEVMMNSQHNVKAEDYEKNKLTTREMYAYQQMEVMPGQLQKIVTTQLKQAFKKTTSTDEVPDLEEVEKWITGRLMKFDVGTGEEKLGRQKILLDILDEIPRIYPEIADNLDLSCFAFTPDMKKMAETRFAKMTKDYSKLWDDIKDNEDLAVPDRGAKKPGEDPEVRKKLVAELKKAISDYKPKLAPAIEDVLSPLGETVGARLRMAWDKIAGTTGRPPIGLGSENPNKKLLLPALQNFDKIIASITDPEIKEILTSGLAVPLRKDVESLSDEKQMEVPFGGKIPNTSPPVTLPDQELAKYTSKGVPRALVKNTSKECLEAIDKLIKDQGNPASEGYQFLWAILGKPKADMIRARLADGGPHVEKNQSKVALAKLFDKGKPPSKEVVERYKKQMAKNTEGDFMPFVKMSEDHLAQNEKEYPETKASCDAIRKLPEEQRVALYKYTQEKYNQFNGQILFPASAKGGNGPKSADLEEQIDALTLTRAALDGLPAFSGTVFRSDEKKFYDDYQKDAVISRFSLTSTAAAKGSELSGSKYDCSIQIETTTGRDISGCSLKPAEREVLIPPGTSFRVTEREEKDGILKLKLVEV